MYHGAYYRKGDLGVSEVRIPKTTRKRLITHKIEGKLKSVLISANVLISPYFGYEYNEYYEIVSIQTTPWGVSFTTREDLRIIKHIHAKYRAKSNTEVLLNLIKEGRLGTATRSAATAVTYVTSALAYKIRHPEWPVDMGVER